MVRRAKFSKYKVLRLRASQLKSLRLAREALQRKRQKTLDGEGETGPQDEWLSCQTDVNKLVQRTGSIVSFNPDEAWPEEVKNVAEEAKNVSDEANDVAEETKYDVAEETKYEVAVEAEDVVDTEAIKLEQQPDEWVIEKLLCRGCHAEGHFTSLQETHPNEDVTYGDMLTTCFSIQIGSSCAGALRALCGLCAVRLRDAHAFCQQVRACEERFQMLYQNNCIKVAATFKTEVEESSEINEDVALESDAYENSLKYLVNIEMAPEQKNETSTESDAKPIKKSERKRKFYKKLPKQVWPASVLNEYVTRICSDRYKCKQCEKVFSKVEAFYRHNSKMHINLPHPCQVCDKAFRTKALQNKHELEEHKEQSYPCQLCKEPFNTNVQRMDHELKEHNISEHDKKQLFPCQFCKEPFESKVLRVEHKLKEHNIGQQNKKRSYPCQLCKESFDTKVQRMRHELNEHDIDQRFKCNACDRAYFRGQQLVNHKNSYHMLGEVLKCANCNYECYNKSVLRKHMVKHKTSKDYHCKYCKKSFLRRGTMQFHERIHTGDKRKVCAECGQAFVQKASLNYHMMKYHPEVNF